MFTVSTGNTPLSVLLAIAKTPPLEAFHPPNSLISLSSPGAIFWSAPTSLIEAIFVSLAIFVGKFIRLSATSLRFALSPGNVYVWFADGSVSVVAPSVRNGLLLSNAFPWRSSLEPEFAIEFVPEAFSVFVALIPTVAFPFVVSTAGACFLSSGFVCNFVVAVTNLIRANFNSAWIVALFRADFASSKTVFRYWTLSSVLEAYFPLVKFPSISAINAVNSVLSKVATVEFASSVVGSVFSIRDLSSLSFAVGFATVVWSPLTAWTSLAETAALPINKYKADIATDAAPKLTFLIEKRSCFSL